MQTSSNQDVNEIVASVASVYTPEPSADVTPVQFQTFVRQLTSVFVQKRSGTLSAGDAECTVDRLCAEFRCEVVQTTDSSVSGDIVTACAERSQIQTLDVVPALQGMEDNEFKRRMLLGTFFLLFK